MKSYQEDVNAKSEVGMNSKLHVANAILPPQLSPFMLRGLVLYHEYEKWTAV